MAHRQHSMVTAIAPELWDTMPTRPVTRAIDYEELCQLYLAALSFRDRDETKAKRMIEAHCVNNGFAV